MRMQDIEIGMPVLYLSKHRLLTEGQVEPKDDELGIVSSKNEKYVFVKYNGSETAQATNPDDIYSLSHRPDLVERMGLEVKPINRTCELYLEQKDLWGKQQ